MRVLGALLLVLVVGFIGVMGFYWLRDGSLEEAGREMDENLAGIDRSTEPLQESVGELGDGIKESVENATDGDDRT